MLTTHDIRVHKLGGLIAQLNEQMLMLGDERFKVGAFDAPDLLADAQDLLHECPLAADAQEYLATMPNQAWVWRSIKMVLEMRTPCTYKRPISKFELQIVHFLHGKKAGAHHDFSYRLDELSAGQSCQRMLDGFLLVGQNPRLLSADSAGQGDSQDDSAEMVPNPLFQALYEKH